MDIKALLKSEQSLNFVEYMRKVLDPNFYSTAYSNLMGFTIDGQRLQFKNYYELKEIPTDAVLAEFLPEIDSFKMVVNFWDRDVKSSLALALKLDDTATKYFHVKFGRFTPQVIMPRPPALLSLLKNRTPPAGMSYEYNEDGTVLKKYYLYIEDPDDMAKVLEFNKIKANHCDLEQLECYYTDAKEFKVNLVYVRPPLTPPEMGALDVATRKAYEDVSKFLFDNKKPTWYIGITKSGKLSVYFTTTDDKDFLSTL